MSTPTAPRWTNPSVRRLAPHGDPVDVVTERARALIVEAFDRGWTGPPFDPVELAELLGIDLVPREDVRDARLVPGKTRRVVEYNPTRAPARVRYSIAHEIAHTLFPDCDEEVRRRADRQETTTVGWELEALCNVAAAELLMPAGTLPEIAPSLLKIDRVDEFRRQYQVSWEAALIRIVHLARFPCAMFSASMVEKGPNSGRFRLDYMVPSNSWRHRRAHALLLPAETSLRQCSGIGFTNVDDEDWGLADGKTHLECVGVPGFPGSSRPRVVGALTHGVAALSGSCGVTELTGDAASPRDGGERILVHVVNNQARSWGGGGFAQAVRRKWPHVHDDFCAWAANRESLTLGRIHEAEAEDGLSVVSMVCQHGYGPSTRPRIRYQPLRACLHEVATIAARRRATLHMPKIGTGQAGGRWEIIRELLLEAVCAHDVRGFVYSPPGQRPKEQAQQELPFA